MLNCSMLITAKNMQILAQKYHLILLLGEKKSQKGDLKQKFALYFIMYIFYFSISNKNFISCIITLECCIRQKFLLLGLSLGREKENPKIHLDQ